MKKKPSLPYFSTSLEKGLNVLRLFTRDGQNWTLTQIAENLGINKTSAYRFVNTLVKLGYLKKHSKTKVLSIGPQMLTLVSANYAGNDLRQISKPFVDDVFETHNINVEVARYDEDRMVRVYRRELKDAFVPRYSIGKRYEQFYSTSMGKAFLAHLPQEEMMRFVKKLPLVPRTGNTITSEAELIADLEKTRQRGYALNNEELLLGLIAIAAPILNLGTNKVIGAVSCDFATIQYTIKMIETRYAEVILKLARDISQVVLE